MRYNIFILLILGMLVTAGRAAIPENVPDTTGEKKLQWGVTAITEGQWDMSCGAGAWANLLKADISTSLWRGARAEAGGMSAYSCGSELGGVMQDFSNINASNRGFRLIHLGLQQQLGPSVWLFAGLRQADEDYFTGNMASLFTGASYGCPPIVNDNYGINVYPTSALSLHAEWLVSERVVLKSSLCNGLSSDRLGQQFRFRPRRDGIINLGSVTYTTADGEEELPAYYNFTYNIGNHRHSSREKRHTQYGFFATAEQPLLRIGRTHLCVMATGAIEFNDPAEAKGYWNAGAALDNLTKRGGTLAVSISRAYYVDGHETDLEGTFRLPLTSFLCLQPAVHYFCSSGDNRVIGQLRLIAEF